MRSRLPVTVLVVGALVTGIGPLPAGAQSGAGPAAGPTGTGPGVDVQVGPNGTLDVQGPRGADADLNGANFRGSFGASRPLPGAVPQGATPLGTLPVPRRLPPPSFLPNLPATAEGGEPGNTPRAADSTDLADLILPRFRRAAASGRVPAPAAAAAPDGWRYQFFGGRWWYWQSQGAWVFWDGQTWHPFAGSR